MLDNLNLFAGTYIQGKRLHTKVVLLEGEGMGVCDKPSLESGRGK
jgi:hypothetical protein